MGYISDYKYYENEGISPTDLNQGSYQYVTLAEIVNNFMLIYQGNNELLNNINRYQVLFHAKRGIQELNYDALKEVKVLELNVCDDLRFIMPPDFVNWVRISLYKNGILHPMTENIQVAWAKSYTQENDCSILFDVNNNIVPKTSDITAERLAGTAKTLYLGASSEFYNTLGYNFGGEWYFDYTLGQRHGMNTETANSNPVFNINKAEGVINFSSGISGEKVVLEYISDGMEKGNDADVSINKFFEDYIYAHIRYSILNNRFGVQEYVVNRARKDRGVLYRNAKLRLSNIHPGRLLMNLRGQNKVLK